ncbi:MAG TPA: EamA family transporter [Ferrovibrio sp.]|uniref:EamA family transporter n=1 Tax=Ferrovibrio sp. TaxID=1917215 RepID=UPI002ED51742
MTRGSDLLLTAIAPVVWGSTYIVTTELLPQGYPLSVAALRALPAGLLLLLFVRRLPHGIWWLRSVLLGGLNIALFLTMLFVSAYRLPGGVAATVISVQPLIVILLARLLLGSPVRLLAILAGMAGVGGVALLVLTPNAALDAIGVAAAITGAISMAAGTVLARRWQPPVSPLAFTAWQLTAGGILLLPVAFWLEPPLPAPSIANIAGFLYLGLIGAALTYALWFRGIARLEPTAVSPLALLSPVTAVLLGWSIAGENLSGLQIAGIAIVIGSVWLSQRAQLAAGVRAPAASPARP